MAGGETVTWHSTIASLLLLAELLEELGLNYTDNQVVYIEEFHRE
jgi:hypothetical protein